MAQSNTSVRRLFVLLCGYEVLPKTVSTRDRGQRFLLSEPISAYLLDTESGWILIDTGFDPANISRCGRDESELLPVTAFIPPLVSAEHRSGPPARRNRHQVSRTLATSSSRIFTSTIPAYLKYLPHARVSIQRREHAFGFGGKTTLANLLSDFDLPTVRWHSGRRRLGSRARPDDDRHAWAHRRDISRQWWT
jgi:N-acyl homoserine lactone hydrolase